MTLPAILQPVDREALAVICRAVRSVSRAFPDHGETLAMAMCIELTRRRNAVWAKAGGSAEVGRAEGRSSAPSRPADHVLGERND